VVQVEEVEFIVLAVRGQSFFRRSLDGIVGSV